MRRIANKKLFRLNSKMKVHYCFIDFSRTMSSTEEDPTRLEFDKNPFSQIQNFPGESPLDLWDKNVNSLAYRISSTVTGRKISLLKKEYHPYHEMQRGLSYVSVFLRLEWQALVLCWKQWSPKAIKALCTDLSTSVHDRSDTSTCMPSCVISSGSNNWRYGWGLIGIYRLVDSFHWMKSFPCCFRTRGFSS